MKILIIPVSYCYNNFQSSASERFRCNWLLPYLEDADKYDGSQNPENYDAIVYQKAHSDRMVEFTKKYKHKIQVFDTTDPEWMFKEDANIREMSKNISFMTASTADVADGLRENYGLPVHVILDGHESTYYERVKVHEDKKPVLVWFGYSANFHRILPLIPIIEKYKLELVTICEAPVQYGKFVKWDLETVNDEILECDIVLNLPGYYKSNNKSTTAWFLGMPVVEKSSDLFRFMDYKTRIKESNYRHKFVTENYDVAESAVQLTNLINNHKTYETNKNENSKS